MPRPSWKGYLKLSLVSCAVALYNASSSSERVSFNTLNRKTGNRLKQNLVDSESGEPVDTADRVKGYQVAKGQYVMVEESDLEALRIESTKTIEIATFVPQAEVDEIYLDSPYYLAPDGKVPGDAFAVMREGMRGKVGIGKLALYGREYLVAVKPHDRGIVMYTLHRAAEIRSIDVIEELTAVPTTVKPEEVKLAKQVIATFEAPLDLAQFTDEYREGLQRIIDAKIAGQEIVAPTLEAPPQVVNLMDALKKSLDTVSKQKKKPARATVAPPAAKRKRA